MNSFIPWMGGKKLLRNAIIESFPSDGYDRYIEVFGGAGWVLFAKDRHAKLEVYNDADGHLVNLYRCIKHHCSEFQRELEFVLNSRELFFDSLQQLNTRGMTDIQRAARYYTVIRTSYGADRRTFGMRGRNISKMMEALPEIQERLSCVVIENRDFEAIIKAYDRSNALFYLDPPYYGAEKHYDHGFAEADHIRLHASLNDIRGRFVLSYNDSDFVRMLYEGYRIKAVERLNNLTAKHTAGEKYGELIIRNY